MSPLEYLVKFGRDEADATAKRAKVSPGYFNQICYGHRHASWEMAKKLVKHQHPEGKMTPVSIMEHHRTKRAVKEARHAISVRKAEARRAAEARV